MKLFITILALVCLTTFGNAKSLSFSDTTTTEENKIIQGAEVEYDSTNNEDSFDISGIEYGETYNEYETSSPTIDLYYIMANPKIHQDEFSSKFAKAAGFELKLGYLSKTALVASPNILEISYPYLFLSNISSSFATTATNGDINTSLWRFGVGGTSGYGWKLGEHSDIILYNSGAMSWTSTDFKDTVNASIPFAAKDNQKMRDFGDNFRFGTVSEDGIKINIYNPISINVGYEKSFVFPRTMFWYWAASELTELVASSLVDKFVDKVIEKAPVVGPVVSWVLQTGLSYGINTLRTKHMNWPVNTLAPFTMDNIKESLSFSF